MRWRHSFFYGSAILILLATVGGGYYFSPYARERRQARRVVELFNLGGEDLIFCRNLAPQARVFCFEGAFYARALKDMKDGKDNFGNLLKNGLRQAQTLLPGSDNIWAVAFGLSLADSERGPEETPYSFRRDYETIFDFIVDGWALQAAHHFGVDKVIDRCRSSFGDSMVAVCQFGIGRSIFFYRPEYGDEVLKNPVSQAGFDFAATFTNLKRRKENFAAQSHGVRAAEFYKALVARDSDISGDASYFACLDGRHPARCMGDVTGVPN